MTNQPSPFIKRLQESGVVKPFPVPDNAPPDPPPTNEERASTLNDVSAFIRRYVVCTQAQADTLAVWTAHTHAIAAADCTPYMHVTSSGPRSGKTRLLEVIELLARNPIRTADITEAALFHAISDPSNPTTLLLDEVDTVFRGNRSREGLRALLNASYRRGSLVRRIKGGEVVSYEAFGAKIIAGIGKIPDTVADRSIPIVMTRKERGEHVERFRHAEASDDGKQLHDWLRFAFAPSLLTQPFLRAVVDHRPTFPAHLNDRQMDSWESLLSLADVVGGDWPDRIRNASQELHQAGEIDIRG